MCHKRARLDNTCWPSADTRKITTYNSVAFFLNLKKFMVLNMYSDEFGQTMGHYLGVIFNMVL